MSGYVIDRVEQPGPAIEEAMLAAIVAYNETVAGPARYTSTALVVRHEEAEALSGGLLAEFYYDFCFVRYLVVPPDARGQGMGTRLMADVEAIARSRDLAGIWLDTFSFQARGFYEKLGFSCIGTIPHHPRGGERAIMVKVFAN